MEELSTLVVRVKNGDSTAYAAIVQRFQDMAVGYSYALLGDIQLAQDAAQEAFINAYFDWPSLREPAAFPGWFRQIILLLAHGADINEKDEKYGFTALHHAVDLADFLPDYAALGMVDFLIARGAKPDIFVCLWLGDDEGVKASLEKDPASANAIGPNRATPLCYARNVETAQLLLNHGADIFFKLEEGAGFTTPLRWATHYPKVLRFLLGRAGLEIDIFLASVLGDTAQVETALKANPALIRARTGPDHALEPDLTAF